MRKNQIKEELLKLLEFIVLEMNPKSHLEPPQSKTPSSEPPAEGRPPVTMAPCTYSLPYIIEKK